VVERVNYINLQVEGEKVGVKLTCGLKVGDCKVSVVVQARKQRFSQ
jgi:hypothetical protein